MLKFLILGLMAINLNLMAKIKLYSVYDQRALGDVIEAFTQKTGIDVELNSAKGDQLFAMVKSGDGDLYLDKDLVYLNRAQRAKVFQTIDPKMSGGSSEFFSSENQWLLLFYRTRTLIYNTNLISKNKLTNYFQLGLPEFKGKICMREAKSSYNKAWVGYLLTHYPAHLVYSFLGKLSENAVRPLFTSDRDIIRSVSRGDCTLGLVNSYYLPRFIKEDPSFPVRPVFVQQKSVGAHINGIGIGLLRTAKNKKEAMEFIRFMTSLPVQNQIGQAFEQYPVNPQSELSQTLKSFGAFKIDTKGLKNAGFYQNSAFEMMKNQGL